MKDLKVASASWLQQFLSPSLMAAPPYQIDINDAKIKLDQNESPADWPAELKQKVLQHMAKKSWNRYPTAHAPVVTRLLSRSLGVSEECVLTAPGSDHLLALILNTFTQKMTGDLRIARPSFPMYEAHCRYYDIAFKPWLLNDDLQYDPAGLKGLPKSSLVIFASPNNPVGNSLSYDALEALLQLNPDSLFVADEAYYEFSSTPYTPLLDQYSNLILVRTFSKVLSAAGLRLGYMIANKAIVAEVKKPRLPYLLNEFTVSAVEVLFNDSTIIEGFNLEVAKVVKKREELRETLKGMAKNLGIRVYPSDANFLLLRWNNEPACQSAYQSLIKQGVQTRNVSRTPGLAGCLRVTVGADAENDKFISALKATANHPDRS